MHVGPIRKNFPNWTHCGKYIVYQQQTLIEFCLCWCVCVLRDKNTLTKSNLEERSFILAYSAGVHCGGRDITTGREGTVEGTSYWLSQCIPKQGGVEGIGVEGRRQLHLQPRDVLHQDSTSLRLTSLRFRNIPNDTTRWRPAFKHLSLLGDIEYSDPESVYSCIVISV